MTDLSGLTRLHCASTCTAERCVISERAICTHPCKGGLQTALQRDAATVYRFEQASIALGIINDPATGRLANATKTTIAVGADGSLKEIEIANEDAA